MPHGVHSTTAYFACYSGYVAWVTVHGLRRRHAGAAIELRVSNILLLSCYEKYVSKIVLFMLCLRMIFPYTPKY